MKKSIIYLFLTILIAAALLNISSSIKRKQSLQRKPLPQKIFKDNVFYEDDQIVIYEKNRQVSIINKDTGQELQSKFSKTVKRIRNKREDVVPLVGMAINEGIKLVDDHEIRIIETKPQFRLLSVYPNPWTKQDKIIISKNNNFLYLYKNGELYKTYPVATGEYSQYTPEGKFKIVNKIVDRGDELNEQLGRRWMGLSVPFEKDNRAEKDARAPVGNKYGIHGTDEPESIGKYVSGGCIRMDNKHIDEVFELVELGTLVEIRGEN